MNESGLSFGRAFGALIKEKRGQEGLTQRELAIRAFDDESKVRRIIELERGLVRSPHVRTLDPLVAYFGITPAELERCNLAAASTETSNFGLSRLLMENLALRFEHENPDAPDEELISYLQNKATELRELKARLAAIEATSSSITNQLAAANAALDEGRFDEADTILAAAEELQQEERTFAEINRQAEIRAARADAAQFHGDAKVAADHYQKAAEYFLGFDTEKTASRLDEYAGRIYEVERRRPLPHLEGAIRLARRANDLTSSASAPVDRAYRAYHLALIEVNEARKEDENAAVLIDDAIEKAASALSHGRDVLNEFDLASCEVALANALLLRGDTSEGPSAASDLRSAIEILERLLADGKNSKALESHLCHLQNNVSAGYRHLSRLVEDAESAALKGKARAALFEAIRLGSFYADSYGWASAQYNLGAVYGEDAQDEQGETAAFLRIQAIACFQAALEAFPVTAFATQFAEAQSAMSRVLLDQAHEEPRAALREVYLLRAIGASEAVKSVFKKAQRPDRWAEAEFQIGIAFCLHADGAEKAMAISDFGRAIECLEAAAEVFRTSGWSDYLEKCTAALDRSRREQQTLQEE